MAVHACIQALGQAQQLCAGRWDHGKPPDLDNLVLLSFKEAEQHEESSLADIRQEDPEYHAHVTSVLQSL